MTPTTKRISGHDLAHAMGGDPACDAAILRAVIDLQLTFHWLTLNECRVILDYIDSTGPTRRQATEKARKNLFGGSGAEPSGTPRETVGASAQRRSSRAPARRLALTTTTAEYRRSDLRRALNRRFRRTQVIGLLADGILLAEAEQLVDEAIRGALGQATPDGMTPAELEQVLEAIACKSPRLRSHIQLVRTRLRY